MMEDQLISDFRLRTGANQSDALCCLRTWGWDLKKALIDYNDTSTTEYFNGRAGLKVSMDYVTTHPNNNNNNNISNTNNNNNNISNNRKPSLTKSDSIDIVDYKKLYRGISRATETNVNLVSRARTELGMDFHTDYHKSIENFQSIDTPEFTFTLPDLTVYPDEFRKFLEKDLIECSTLNALETSRHLNWWADTGVCRKLWPLATTGDGNCLLHAASLAMWGFHDRKLTLRTALYGILSKHEYRDAIWRRWRFQQTRLNKQAGFVYSEIEWAKEWDEIVTMASPEPRRSNGSNTTANNNNNNNGPSQRRRSLAFDRQNSGDHHHNNNNTNNNNCGGIDDNATYESLEEIHIFALAHVLRRTIIVISDTVLRDMNGEAMAPIPFGGVYLPFEIPANECHRAPLLLTYDMAHFSALVAMESPTTATATTTTTIPSTTSPSESSTILNNLNQNTTTSPIDESSQQQLQQPPALIPLISYENILLPIQFCIDPGEHFDWRNYDGSEGNWTLTDREHIALLKEYLDIIYASPMGLGGGGGAGSPDEEIYDDLTDEEIERRIGEAEIVLTDDCTDNSYTNYNNSNGNGNVNGTAKQSKAAKQLQSVAKQFGSIGKNMSKKIKKNIGSITKIGGGGGGGGNGGQNNGKSNKKLSSGQSTQSFTKQRILCARLKAKRHVYQEEMIRNYLECAQNRFLANENTKDLCLVEKHQLINDDAQIINQQHCQSSSSSSSSPLSSSQSDKTNQLGVINESTSISSTSTSTAPTLCINVGCINYGTSKTSYMCPECFENQKQHELHRNLIMEAPPRYGTGNSRFYTQSDMQSHKMIKRLPSVRRLNELDQTLYLSNSTFYNDNKSIINDDHRSANIIQVNGGGSTTTNNLNRSNYNNNNNSNNNNNNNNINSNINNGPNTSFRHGYSPTENTRAIVTRRIPITIEKRNGIDDNDDDDDDVVVDENDLENIDYNRNSANNKLNNNYLNNTNNVCNNNNSNNNNNNNNTSVIPWGTVRVYSPGNTVRQNAIIQQQQQHHISIPIQKEDLILLGNDSDYDNVDGTQSKLSIKNKHQQASPSQAVSSVYLNNTTNSNGSSNRSSINNDFIHFDENSRNTTSFLSSRILKVNTNNAIMGPPATSSVPVSASSKQNGMKTPVVAAAAIAAAATAPQCRTHGCLFYGSPDSNYYCSKCYPIYASTSSSSSSSSASHQQRHQQQKTQSKILTDV